MSIDTDAQGAEPGTKGTHEMFQAYALAALIGLNDPHDARDLAHRVALRDAMIAAGCRRSLATRIRSFLATGRRADLAACRA